MNSVCVSHSQKVEEIIPERRLLCLDMFNPLGWKEPSLNSRQHGRSNENHENGREYVMM